MNRHHGRGTRWGTRWGTVLALMLLLLPPLGQPPARAQAAATVQRFTQAEATLQPDGMPLQRRQVELEHRWGQDYPAIGGRASYRIGLPPASGPQPMALLFTRIGNQAEVRINGVMLQQFGTLGDTSFDAAKSSRRVVVPGTTLLRDAPNVLTVSLTLQAQRGGGLSVVNYGPNDLIDRLEDHQALTRDFASVVYAVGLFITGAFTAALWWRQRDALYGVFSLAAFSGVLRNLDRVWPEPPLPWPLWGALLAVAYACHLALIARFTLLAIGRNPRWLVRALYGSMGAAAVLGFVALVGARPLLWTVGLAGLEAVGLVCLFLIWQMALRGQHRTAWVMVVAGSLTLLCGTHDLLFVRINLGGTEAAPLMPHAMFVFVLIMAGMVVERYTRSITDYRMLNATLSQRVAKRERQLGDAFEALRVQQQEQAVAGERQRIMREIHDGVGSQLVGLLNMVTQRDAEPAQLEAQVQLALDEMRMAVDSLQPVHGDLGTVLGTLRYRLQPRLHAAGIAVRWDVEQLPPLAHLSPHSVWQVQRILMEALTNVLKHARASEVTVQAHWRGGAAPAVSLALSDDGVGLHHGRTDGDAVHGHGLANMRSRAAAIGAQLRVEAGAGGGTRVALELPLTPLSQPSTGA